MKPSLLSRASTNHILWFTPSSLHPRFYLYFCPCLLHTLISQAPSTVTETWQALQKQFLLNMKLGGKYKVKSKTGNHEGLP